MDRSLSVWFSASISLIAYAYLAYLIERTEFIALMLSVSVLFLAYWNLVKMGSKLRINEMFALGLLFRLLFLFSMPALSDDFYRFIWDGELMNRGISPFLYQPAELSFDLPAKELLLEKMNSPNYYSVYPPFLQLFFALAVALGGSLLQTVFWLHLIIVAAEAATFFFLVKSLDLLKKPRALALIYFLNPLIIIELSGNLHFEGLMLCFFSAAFYFLLKKRSTVSGVFWSLAFGVKMIPLILLPSVVRRLSFKKLVLFGVGFIASGLISWYSLLDFQLIGNFQNSFDLYFEKFEFNASIYYLAREIGFWIKGHNTIYLVGPFLKWLSFGLILFLLLRKKLKDNDRFFRTALLALSLYFFLALVVHPWYLSSLVFLTVFYRFSYPLLWSFTVFFSYYAYRESGFEEHWLFLLLQYLPVYALFLLELFTTDHPVSFFRKMKNIYFQSVKVKS